MGRQRAALKDQLFNRDKVARIAEELRGAHRGFAAEAFVAEVTSRFPELELKQRIAWITNCLESHLPTDYRRAVDVLLRSLPAPCDPNRTDGDFGDFIYAPYAEFVARHGCSAEDLDFSLDTLKEVTTRFSAEEAIRYFINAYPSETLHALQAWTSHEHYHVRRLCSEGTRPRLPWAKGLATPIEAALPILDRLYYDRTRFVTRSVANHVNDISKVDPDLAVDTLLSWRDSKRQTDKEMDYLVRHATRSLIKQGHAGALELIGVPTQADITVRDLEVPQRVALGQLLHFAVTISSSQPCEVVADYAIRFQGKSGHLTSRKVYKLKRLSLGPGEIVVLTKSHPLIATMTTRQIHPGRHELEVQINGQVRTHQAFTVTPTPKPAASLGSSQGIRPVRSSA